MAVIFSFLSNFRNTRNEDTYILTNGSKDSFPGRYTNDAPILYLMSESSKENPNEEIKIIFIVSKEVYTTKCFNDNFEEIPGEKVEGKFNEYNYPDGTKTIYDFYKHFFESGSYLEKKIPRNVTVEYIPYDMRKEDDKIVKITDDREIANQVYLKAAEKFKGEEKVYIDYTGGLRDMSYLMVLIIDYFKLAGIECKTIVYSNWNEKKLVPINYIHNISKIIHAVDDFADTGSVDSLNKIITENSDASCDEVGKNKREIIKKIVESLDSFVKEISIGNVDALDKICRDIKRAIGEAEKNNTETSDLYSNIFMTLIPKIRESLYMDGTSSELDYPEIVKWCVEHRFLQQAATIYVEKMPAIYLKAGLEDIVSPQLISGKTTATKESQQFYSVFWDALAKCRFPYTKGYVEFVSSKCKSYQQKVRAIDYLKKFQLCYGGCEELIQVLSYYLAIKIIRNHMNHASEMRGDDFTAYNLLFGKNERTFTYEVAKKRILEGVELSQRIRNEKKPLAIKEVKNAVNDYYKTKKV